jgi:ABC-type phosphate/phosphonate transport system permease subunit
MLWDILFAAGIGLTQLVLTWYGVHVSVRENRIRNAIIIALVGFVGIGLTVGGTIRNSINQDRLQAQLNKIQRNTEQPPTVQVNVPPLRF